jgi:uncharacterized iron-regulated membrane protein
MLTARKIKIWSSVHTWTSLVCTAFLLMLCVTGLPLIFYHEIDHLTSATAEPVAMPANAPRADLDRIVAAGKAQRSNEVVQYLTWDRDEPELLHFFSAPKIEATEVTGMVVFDNRTGEILGKPPLQEGVMYVLLKLHVDMFAGLPGKLFLGFMGLLFVVAIVSGVVVYGPFMRRLDFGTVRKDRSKRLKWLDLHNLIGAVTLAWALVVGFTGAINTLADVLLNVWKADQLAAMVAPYKDKPPLARIGSVQAAVDIARQAAPGMTPAFVAWPGTPLSSNHHYGVFMRGDAPLTARLFKPVLIDAETGAVTDTRELPWYMKALLISQPLHFGDYGGMPLKIIWALLDIATIIVLVSGLYLWVARRRAASRARPTEFPATQLAAARQPAE